MTWLIFFSSVLFWRIISYTGELHKVPRMSTWNLNKNIGHFGENKGRTYLPLVGKGKPSNAHDTCGVGFPAAEHFKDTAGPG